MTPTPCSCRHAFVSGLAARQGVAGLGVGRCRPHSRDADGVSVWFWGAGGEPRGECLCAVADRFLVAGAGAAPRWRQSADVVVALPGAGVGSAMETVEAQLARAPGCALAVVPVPASGTVFGTRTERALVRHESEHAPVCGVCVYPWLAAGFRLAHLVGSLRLTASSLSGR